MRTGISWWGRFAFTALLGYTLLSPAMTVYASTLPVHSSESLPIERTIKSPAVATYQSSYTTINSTPSQSSDDIWVYRDGSSVWQRSLTSTSGASGYYLSTQTRQGVGTVFRNVDIPQDATVTNAYITFTAADTRGNDTVTTVLIGQNTNAPATFSTVANYQGRRGTVVGGADNTNLTSANVTWAPPDMTAGNTYNTPDISSIIQEIVDLPGWVGDGTDDIAIFWDDHAAAGTQTNIVERTVRSYDNGSAFPILYVTYDT